MEEEEEALCLSACLPAGPPCCEMLPCNSRLSSNEGL